MEPHTQHEYQQTFSLVATSLERVTEVLEAQARLGAETDGRIDRLGSQVDRLGTQVDRLSAQVERLAAHVNVIDLKLSEATDKLNGVIDLMDRHLREHGNN